MNTIHSERLTANDELARRMHRRRLDGLQGQQADRARRHTQEEAALEAAILREGRSERVRLAVREICSLLLDPDRTAGLPPVEVLEAALAWVAGSLACCDLDEPAGLKVRRLGRRMATETIVF